MLNFSLDELRLVAENRTIGGYKSMSKNQLINLFRITAALKPIVEDTPVRKPMKPEDRLMLKKFKRKKK